MKYAICDIETTGGNCKNGKIIEIAIIVIEDMKIIDSFSSLVNPEMPITPFVSKLTGITEEMTSNAPKFHEIADEIIQITDNAIFVGHNASFDYNYIVEEFAKLGYKFSRKKLCTLSISKKLLPGQSSYSLGKLCKSLGIDINNRHRAFGDASATAELFMFLKNTGLPDEPDVLKNNLNLNPLLSLDSFKKIPEKEGVYKFFNKDNELIYAGNGSNMHHSVMDIFYDHNATNSEIIREECAKIEFEETDSKMISLLKHLKTIKETKPILKSNFKKHLYKFGIYTNEDENGFINFYISHTAKKYPKLPLNIFQTHELALSFLLRKIKKFNLYKHLCGIENAKHDNVVKENPNTYNKRAQKAIEEILMKNLNFVIIDNEHINDEIPFAIIENYKKIGYGYLK